MPSKLCGIAQVEMTRSGMMNWTNVSKALSEMQRITKQNGYNAVKVYAGTPSEIAFRPKYSIFNFGELREIYDSIGWEILEHDERHDIPASTKDGISSYSRIIARKPEKNKEQKLELLREAEYYRRSDVEHYEYLMMLLSKL
ncbi:hypothetical protein H7171_01330 [Candidatus Saccharibacteria bacterium]|nr:hypothetical protein [Candidatus Saccharibacteria bacterium]